MKFKYTRVSEARDAALRKDTCERNDATPIQTSPRMTVIYLLDPLASRRTVSGRERSFESEGQRVHQNVLRIK